MALPQHPKEFDPIPALQTFLNHPKHFLLTVVKLLDEANTIPFIARYRKEATGNLDEVQLRTIQERLNDLRELDSRKQFILKSIESQEKLTDELREKIHSCEMKNDLEDLYLPFKPKRKTRASLAKEKGLEPLALRILEQPLQEKPEEEARTFISAEKGVLSVQEALAGARDIVAERVAENATVRSFVRQAYFEKGLICSQINGDKPLVPTKFEQYYDFKESIAKIPSHRYLAIRRGEQEGILQLHIEIEKEDILSNILSIVKINHLSSYAIHLNDAIADSYKRLINPSAETDIRVHLKMKSDQSAVDIFADNLRGLLMAPPMGSRNVIGIDPGIRTGCKCAVVDNTGMFIETFTIYPFQDDRLKDKAFNDLQAHINKFNPFAIAVGNGTAGRETESFIRLILKETQHVQTIVVSVNESGASVYSASDIAREEFPDLDLTIRGAISIARRLQDPLAELVKVDPKAIGVGQYQHDVYQPLLQEKLHEVVESCVNQVGVDLNTASAPLLSYVAGIGSSLANKIVRFRHENGTFQSRKQLLEVPGLGPRTFEQAAGFLRVHESEHPLDSSAVHPERYSLVELMAKDLKIPLRDLVGNAPLVNQIDIQRYVSESVGKFTLQDVLSELVKPGRDPRADFERPNFRDDVISIKDLKEGMSLEGIVTNVTAFGAFVDIGVHQDGLVHISELSDNFVKDPRDFIQVGDKLKVKVLAIDKERNRITLTAKTLDHRASFSPKATSSNRQMPVKKDNKIFQHNPFSAL